MQPNNESTITTTIQNNTYFTSSMFKQNAIETNKHNNPITLKVLKALFLKAINNTTLTSIKFLINTTFITQKKKYKLTIIQTLKEHYKILSLILTIKQIILLTYNLINKITIKLILN